MFLLKNLVRKGLLGSWTVCEMSSLSFTYGIRITPDTNAFSVPGGNLYAIIHSLHHAVYQDRVGRGINGNVAVETSLIPNTEYLKEKTNIRIQFLWTDSPLS